MNEKNFHIEKFNNLIYAIDRKNRKIEVKNRYSACFIVNIKGKIRFSCSGGQYIVDAQHPIFLPQGISYTNECLEDAESYVFNFFTFEKFSRPILLSPLPDSFTKQYASIVKENASLPQNELLIFSALYALAHRLFFKETNPTTTEKLFLRAKEFLSANYADATLTAQKIANECYISSVYLRKLFRKYAQSTPFKVLTDIRMEYAFYLAKEKRSVKEIAESVGYSDVYQFSRAYKKYYGYSPSKT